MEYWGEGLEDDTLLRVLESIAFGHVLVITVESLNSHVILERLVEVLHALHVQLNVCVATSAYYQLFLRRSSTIELLNPRRLVVYIDTFDVALHLADKQLGDRAFCLRPL